MTCETGVCGTGGWGGPKPGDPDGNSILSATPGFGGIDIRWTYPLINPFAVAYTIIYRALSADFNGSIVIQDPAGGGFYFDKVAPPTEYFYWIQFVSINGTHGDVIGPVSAVARSSIDQTIIELTGKIDAGLLAQALKTEIARIPLIDDRIFQEITDRLEANTVLANALASVQNASDQTLTYVQQEITQRQSADSAQVDAITVLYAQTAGNAAAITEEQTIRVSKDEALAQRIDSLAASTGTDTAAAITEERTARVNADASLAQDITTLYSLHGNNVAAIINESTARSDADSASATQITDLYAKYNAVNGDTSTLIQAAIQSEQTARAAADGALAQDITTLFTRAGTADAAIQNEATARANQDNALAVQISTTTAALHDTISGEVTAAVQSESTARTNAINGAINSLAAHVDTVESAAGTNLAQAQSTLQTNINTVNGKVTEIGALYTMKLQVGGLFGGFGVYNDGSTVEAGFDVDMFWVGRTSADKKKPFIISGGEVFIDDAVIEKLVFTKLRADDGSFIFEDGKLKAEYINVGELTAKHIDVGSGVTGTHTEYKDTGMYVYIAGMALPLVECGIYIT